jgi:hypothetical protein
MKLTEFRTAPSAKQMNKVMESRFGFAVNYDNLSFKKAYTLSKALGESLDQIKRTHGQHVAEKNAKYMEMLLVREGLNRWMVENETRLINESEMGKSQAILAAKDMVDSIQDMLEKVSKMQSEQMPALLDTIRDQIGQQQADAFKNSLGTILASMVEQLSSARETADGAARSLAGEQVAQPMAMPGAPDADTGSDLSDLDLDMDADSDGFGATDAAAGGSEELGREKR